MGLLDLILFPLYVFIFYLIFAARRKRLESPILKKYHANGFWIKVAAALAYTIFSYYISTGDSTSLYYKEGENIFRLILHDPAQYLKLLVIPGKDFDGSLLADSYNNGYFKSESNYFITVLTAFFAFFTFDRYLLINLVFSMIAYSGIWRLYKFFYEQYPHLHKRLAIAILYLPTFIFWSSGILKDSICIGMLGWMTYALFAIFYKKESVIKNLIIAVISGYILGVIKIYILISYVPFFILFLVLIKVRSIQSIIKKIAVLFFMLLLCVGGFFLVASQLKEELGNFAIDKLTETVQSQQGTFIAMAGAAESSFSLGVEFDGSTSSMLKMAPAAITATLYRPFLWESKKVSTLLSSLESLAIMLFTLYVFFRVGPFNFIASFFKSPMILFCFSFSIVFALFVGATTLNFGTLVRYKIPCMPFYVIALFLILDIHNKKKSSRALKKQAALSQQYN
jgi:hypothetical protein